MNEDRFRFRVWDKEKERWATDKDDGLILFTDGSLGSVDFDCWDGGCTTDQKYLSKYIKEFSTGLRDKNGKLSFGGDILGVGKFKVLVEWDDKLARFRLKTISGSGVEYRDMDLASSMEIIGDIHTTPELKC